MPLGVPQNAESFLARERGLTNYQQKKITFTFAANQPERVFRVTISPEERSSDLFPVFVDHWTRTLSHP